VIGDKQLLLAVGPEYAARMTDERFMTEALELAIAGLGSVWPNPTVGAVVVHEGEVVGRGRTQPRGRPHAEVVALKEAADRARGATMYVSLEPCCHWGQTPPCTDALIRAGIRRVVVSATDPDPRVNGAGIRRLQRAGIEVSVGLLSDRGRAVNAGFFARIRLGRPQVVRIEPGGDWERFDGVWTEAGGPIVVSAGDQLYERWGLEYPGHTPGASERLFWLTHPPLTPAGFQDVLRQLAEAGLTRLAVAAEPADVAEALAILDSDPA
jgi:pyrimidine deaminase RibD-like protein